MMAQRAAACAETDLIVPPNRGCPRPTMPLYGRSPTMPQWVRWSAVPRDGFLDSAAVGAVSSEEAIESE
jgi:hypothetical protein